MRSLIILFLFVIQSFFFLFNAYAQGYPEHEVKVAYIYNIIKFVEWPPYAKLDSNLNICIYGENTFGNAFNLIQNKDISGKTINVLHIKSIQKVKMCHILFISNSEKNNLSQIFDEIKGLPIITMGDTDGFAQKGVIINFFLENNKIRFEINLSSAEKLGIKISSKLLKLARKVYEE